MRKRIRHLKDIVGQVQECFFVDCFMRYLEVKRNDSEIV